MTEEEARMAIMQAAIRLGVVFDAACPEGPTPPATPTREDEADG